MKLANFKWFALSVIVLAGCGDSKSDNELDNPDGPQGSGTTEVMTPEKSKTFLQNTATDFLNKFNPEDQKAAIELAAYYAEEYGDLDAPEEFIIKADGKNRMPATYLKALAAAAKGDMDGLTRAATAYSYTIKFGQFTGVYEPNTKKGEWVKTGESKDVVFKFTNKGGQPVELTVSQDGGTYDVDFTINDWDWDYDEATGSWEDFEVEHNYYLSVPKKVNVSLKENGKELANSSVVSSIDVKGHTLSAEVVANLMNLKAEANVAGNDSKVEANTSFYVSGEIVATAYATVTGNHLCDKTKYQSFEDMDDDEVEEELSKMLKNGDCGVDVLGKVQVYGQVTYYKELPSDLDGWFDSYDYESKETAHNECQRACNRLNDKIKTQLRYDKTATDQATLQFIPGLDEWGSYSWEYYVTCNLLFPDKTTYSIDSYFENFTNVTNKWDTLLDAYEKIWDSAKVRK